MIALLLALGFFSSPSQAGGSVDFAEQVKPLLDKSPEFSRSLNGFVLGDEGEGTRIDQEICPALAGIRLGAYVFPAWSRRNPGDAFTVTILTDINFFDRRGRLVWRVRNSEWGAGGEEKLWTAVSFEERVSQVRVERKELAPAMRAGADEFLQ